MPNPTISEFYSKCNLLITGGTGFVGIALIEKLLRTLPDIGNVYLLLRPKRGKEISERLEELIKNPIFDRLKEAHGNERFKKLVAVAGDVGEENLGLSEEDKQLLRDNINIVFHSAATLDFEASLKTTVNINLLGTRRVVGLCKTITNFKGLLHVSSAYVNANLKNADEIIYPAVEDTDKVIELATSLGELALEEITPVLLGNHPNTYTFTKSLAELEVSKDCSPAFPTCIIRPSMIVGAWKEPLPGWTNSKNGPQGFIMGAAKGVVRRLPVDKNLVYDYIPVDIVVNQMITGAWHVSVNRPYETPVFQCTTSVYKPFRWVDVETQITRLLHRYPLSKAVWYPTLKLLPSLFLFKISAFIFHIIPAYILDMVTRIGGGRPILVKLHTNINKSLDRLAPFIFNEWMFDNKKSLGLHHSLSKADQETFGLDVKDLQWEPYFEDLAQGVRRYLNNELPSTLSSARAKDKVLFVLNWILQAVVLSVLWLVVASLMSSSMVNTAWVLPVLYIAFSSL